MYACTYILTHLHVYIYLCMYMYIYLSMHINIYVYVYICMHDHLQIRAPNLALSRALFTNLLCQLVIPASSRCFGNAYVNK